MVKFKEDLTDIQDKDNIFTPITRQKWLGFAENKVKPKFKINGKWKDIAIQRCVLGVLAAKSDQERSSVNTDKALTYPLHPVYLRLTRQNCIK